MLDWEVKEVAPSRSLEYTQRTRTREIHVNNHVMRSMIEVSHIWHAERGQPPLQVYKRAGNLQTIPIPWLLLRHQLDRLFSLACVISFALAMDAGSAFVSLLSYYPPPTSTRMLVQQPPYILYQGRIIWRVTRRRFLLALSTLSHTSRSRYAATSSCHNSLASFTG